MNKNQFISRISVNVIVGKITSMFFLMLFNSSLLQAQNWQFEKTINHRDLNIIYYNGYSLQNNNNNHYAVGSFENYAHYNISDVSLLSAGAKDILIESINPNNTDGFAIQAGGTGDDEAYDMFTTGGYIYVTGYFSGTATFNTTTKTSNGGTDIFIMRYSTSGIFSWVKTFGSTGDDKGKRILVNGASVYVGIEYSGQLVAGSDTLECDGGTDIGYINLTTSGGGGGAKKFCGGPYKEHLNSFVFYGSDLIVGGSISDSAIVGNDTLLTLGNLDIFVGRFNINGNPIWKFNDGGTGNDEANRLLIAYNKVYFCGYYENSWSAGSSSFISNGGTDCYFFHLNLSTGLPERGISYGGVGADTAFAISFDGSNSRIVMGGCMSNTMSCPPFTLTSIDLTDAFLLSTDTAGYFAYATNFGGIGKDVIYSSTCTSSEISVSGHYCRNQNQIIAGYPFDMPKEPLIRNYSFNFVQQWDLTGIITSYSEIQGVSDDKNGNIYVAGKYFGIIDFDTIIVKSINPVAFVAKFDSLGNIVWLLSGINHIASQQTTSLYSQVNLIQTDSTGNIVVAGYFRSLFTLGSSTLNPFYPNVPTGNCDAFLAKITTQGQVVWTKRIASDAFHVNLHSLSLSENGNIQISGDFFSYQLYLEGSMTLIGNNSQTGYLLNYSSSGTGLFRNRVGSNIGKSSVYSVSPDENGNIYIQGVFDGNVGLNDLGIPPSMSGRYDFYVAKLNPSGQLLWYKTMEGAISYLRKSPGIAYDPVGGLYCSGYFNNTITFPDGNQFNPAQAVSSLDLWIARCDTSGTFLWEKHFKPTGIYTPFYALNLVSNNTGVCNISFSYDDSLLIDNTPQPIITQQQEINAFVSFGTNGQISRTYYHPDDKLYSCVLGNSYAPDRILACGRGDFPFSRFGYDTLYSPFLTVGNAYFSVFNDPCVLAQFSYTDSSNIYQFIDNSIFSDSVLWNFGDGNYSTQQNPTHSYINPGVYTVTLIAWGACGLDSSITVINYLISETIGFNAKFSLETYPNPFKNILFFNIKDINYGTEIYTVNLFSSDGKILYNSCCSSGINNLDFSNISSGIYFLRVGNSENGYSIKKIIKQ